VDPERWRRINELFEAALECEDSQREEFLSKACCGDEDLVKQVRALLLADDKENGFMNSPVFDAAPEFIAREFNSYASHVTLPSKTVLQNRYEIVRCINKGGMGAVYETIDLRLGNTVALKQCFFSDEHLRRAFEREARLLAGVRHYVLPKVIDHFTEKKGQFLVMEFILGDDLGELLKRTQYPFALTEVLQWADQLLDALNYLHTHSPTIIHRDIKPNNLKITAERQVALLDFGLAKGAPVIKSRVSASGSIFGYTPNYAPLEQIQGSGSDPRSDLYALAATMYHLITAELPADALTRATMILEGKVDPLKTAHEISPGVPKVLANYLHKAMALNKEERPQTAAVMRQHLRDLGRAILEPACISSGITMKLGDSTVKEQKGFEPDLLLQESQEGAVFIAGPPITSPLHFFGRERELKRIFNLLKHPPLQNAFVIGPQRSGKTSLLHYLRTITVMPSARLRPSQRNNWLSQPDRYRWIFIDFQDIRMRSQKGVLQHILNGLGLIVPPQLDMDSFIEIMSESLRTPAIILMDEVGIAIQRYTELDDPFWEGLRSLATNQVRGNLAFILASSEPPYLLAEQKGLGSPFFNIFGYCTTLGALTETEASELIASSPIPFSREDSDWIIEHSQRWPILLQLLCRERLNSLEFGENDPDWRDDALRQLVPFKHLLS